MLFIPCTIKQMLVAALMVSLEVCFLATVVTWHHWSKLQVVVFHVGFVVVGSPILLAFLLLQGL